MDSNRPTVVLICSGYQQSFEQGRYYDYQEFQRSLVDIGLSPSHQSKKHSTCVFDYGGLNSLPIPSTRSPFVKFIQYRCSL